eukprot:2969469-Amphidinium_carterae.1
MGLVDSSRSWLEHFTLGICFGLHGSSSRIIKDVRWQLEKSAQRKLASGIEDQPSYFLGLDCMHFTVNTVNC